MQNNIFQQHVKLPHNLLKNNNWKLKFNRCKVNQVKINFSKKKKYNLFPFHIQVNVFSYQMQEFYYFFK